MHALTAYQRYNQLRDGLLVDMTGETSVPGELFEAAAPLRLLSVACDQAARAAVTFQAARAAVTF